MSILMIDKLTFNAHQISAWTVEALIILQSTKLTFLDVGAKDKPAIDESEGSAYSQCFFCHSCGLLRHFHPYYQWHISQH